MAAVPQRWFVVVRASLSLLSRHMARRSRSYNLQRAVLMTATNVNGVPPFPSFPPICVFDFILFFANRPKALFRLLYATDRGAAFFHDAGGRGEEVASRFGPNLTVDLQQVAALTQCSGLTQPLLLCQQLRSKTAMTRPRARSVDPPFGKRGGSSGCESTVAKAKRGKAKRGKPQPVANEVVRRCLP